MTKWTKTLTDPLTPRNSLIGWPTYRPGIHWTTPKPNSNKWALIYRPISISPNIYTTTTVLMVCVRSHLFFLTFIYLSFSKFAVLHIYKTKKYNNPPPRRFLSQWARRRVQQGGYRQRQEKVANGGYRRRQPTQLGTIPRFPSPWRLSLHAQRRGTG